MSEEMPTDEQVRGWFPKLFEDIDAELEELDACPTCKGFPEPGCRSHGGMPEPRPADDPPPIPTCGGRNCGGRPHE